jgi:hypothetical protein
MVMAVAGVIGLEFTLTLVQRADSPNQGGPPCRRR